MWNVVVRDNLSQVDGRWLHHLPGSPAKADELSWFLNANGYCARVLRGKRMPQVQSLFAEIGAALQFPFYFGHNWPALAECLSDLEWLKASSYVVVITDSFNLLSSALAGEFDNFFRILKTTSEEWATANHLGATWPHPPIPFHVVLQDGPKPLERTVTRLRSLGFDSSALTAVS